MNLHKLIFTENACYKAGKKITPKGIMVHSTGADNPMLNRYVGPDDGLLGKSKYGNHWNQPMDRKICCHAFIGKLADGTVATYQVLPWKHRGWHGASGVNGSCNDTHIGFEICEDGLKDKVYFEKIYKEAVELCAYLCKKFDLTEKNIIDHREGHALGIASNHGDVKHWFSKHGKSMDDLRADVKVLLKKEESIPEEPVVEEYELGDRSLIKGMTGKDVKELKKALAKLGYDVFDDVFDEETEKGLNKFKADNGLEPNGKAGGGVFRMLKTKGV